MKHCKVCNIEYDGSLMFCSTCGKELDDSIEEELDINEQYNLERKKVVFVRFIAIGLIIIGISISVFSSCDFTPKHKESYSISNEYSSTLSTQKSYDVSTPKVESYSSSKSSTTWHKTAGQTNGDDWMGMNRSQKEDIVSGVISSWKSSDFEVDVSSTYFISALDAFYGDESTNSNNLAEAMTLIGYTGDVIRKK